MTATWWIATDGPPPPCDWCYVAAGHRELDGSPICAACREEHICCVCDGALATEVSENDQYEHGDVMRLCAACHRQVEARIMAQRGYR